MNVPDLIRGIGLPFAYSHFAEGESPDPPFLIWHTPESHNFGADNVVWARSDTIYLELYTDKKDFVAERKVETALHAAGLYWDKSETWIESEKLYEVLYSFGTEVK